MTATDHKTWTIGALLDWTTGHFQKHGSESPRLDAEVLLACAFDCRRIDLYTRYEEEAAAAGRSRFRDLVKKRVDGCPVAYLVGRKEFFSLTFDVTPDVLIPRPESEYVVVECLKHCKDKTSPRILDLGTGSGNLPIALASRHKTAVLTSVDCSRKALELARRNAGKLGVAQRIRFLEGDLFSPVPSGEWFDVIISNPPYIPTADIATLAVGVREYEPHLALDGGEDGFAIFDRIILGARDRLVAGGHLILEIGSPQHETARAKIQSAACYSLADTIYDAARHPRVLVARKS